jgi:CspA family cold shock protein
VPTGTVKWYNHRKGYGFIISEDGTDIFVHYTALAGREEKFVTLHENDKVEFEIVQGQKGPQASNVVIVEKAPYGRGGFRI